MLRVVGDSVVVGRRMAHRVNNLMWERRLSIDTRGWIKRRAPIEVHNMLADEFDYADCSAYYMFSPFGPETVGKVLTKIRKDRDGKPIRVAYANPAYPEAFDRQPWLERYDFWDSAARAAEHSVAFHRDRA
jgi:hypothetical protein